MNAPARIPPVPSKSGVPVGIDLGTTMSVVAYVDAAGRPMTITDDDGQCLIPSEVLIDGSEIRVGEDAAQRAEHAVDAYADSFKRDMGRPHFARPMAGRMVPAEVLSGLVLEELKRRATRVAGPFGRTVIAVPAYFDELQRMATRDAGRLAGLQVDQVINEPVAAAIALGHERNLLYRRDIGRGAVRLMVYDLGGGTFDVSVLEFAGGEYRTLATDGDIQLGGRDFDHRLADVLASRFVERHGIDPRTDAEARHRLERLARATKHRLSCEERAPASLEFRGLRLTTVVTQHDMHQAIAPLVERTLATCEDVLAEAGLAWSDMDHLFLVGGSSRVPLVGERLAEVARRTPELPADSDELVAKGAALYAAAREPDSSVSFGIVNVNSHSMGVAGVDVDTGERINKVLIPRNTRLPATATYRFVTLKDGQRNAVVHVIEGENDNPAFCTRVGHVRMDLPPGTVAGTRIDVTCRYDECGLISVAARVAATRHSVSAVLERTNANAIESLAVWRRRLAGLDVECASRADEPEVPGTASLRVEGDAADGAELSGLDEACLDLGKRVMNRALPSRLVDQHRAIQNALREGAYATALERLVRHALAGAGDRRERAALEGMALHVAMRADAARRLATLMLIALGREFVRAGGHAPDEAARVDAVRRQLDLMTKGTET